jgi:hypothetical protein
MKTLLILLVFCGVAAFGVHFFGLYRVPGMERIPTVESLGKSRQGAIEAEAQRRVNGDPEVPPSPWGAKQGGSLGKRSGQLNQSGKSLGD